MKNSIIVIILVALAAVGGYLYLSQSGSQNDSPVVWVWYPNESTPERAHSREAIIELASKAIGRKIEQQLTTDYSITLESMVHGNAGISWLGAEGYVQASHREPAVQAIAVHSPSGGLKDAKYYSMLGVRKENADQFLKDGKYDLNALRQKSFSFVSNSSTSGFRVPSSIISSQFNVPSEALLEGGPDKIFSDVLFGGSHQGALMNIIEKRAEVGAFCNTCVAHYIEFTKGNFDDPKPGDIVKILPNAPAPFDKLAGEEVVLIASVPVLNECIAVNQKVLTEEQVAALTAALTSDEAAANTAIFGSRKDPVNPTLFEKGHRFVKVEDAWYNPFRTMSNLPLR